MRLILETWRYVVLLLPHLNLLRPEKLGRNFIGDIFPCNFLTENHCMRIILVSICLSIAYIRAKQVTWLQNILKPVPVVIHWTWGRDRNTLFPWTIVVFWFCVYIQKSFNIVLTKVCYVCWRNVFDFEFWIWYCWVLAGYRHDTRKSFI